MNSKLHTKPRSLIGVGLRHPHYSLALSAETLADQVANAQNENGTKHTVDFVEVHAENFFAAGGASQALIQDIAQAYPLSLHGTSLGLGSTLSVPVDILQQFAKLVKSTQPILVSEHLCFNRAEVNGVVLHSGDLLPIPYNTNSLHTIVANVQQVQESIQRPLLIENLSAYITPSQLVAHIKDEMTEFEFLVNMCEAAGCGILLDLNNLIINELNRKTANPLEMIRQRLDTLPAHIVGEIHLAGYTDKSPVAPKDINKARESHFIIDDHGAPVSEECWQLYQYALQKFPGTPTLVEWDTQIPEWSVLLNEADKARSIAENVAINRYTSSLVSHL
jgi:uncharacterized protein (UPF0276 family)